MSFSLETIKVLIYAGLGLILLLGVLLLIKQSLFSPNKAPQQEPLQNKQPNSPSVAVPQTPLTENRAEPEALNSLHPTIPAPPLRKKDSLFSATEARFLLALQEAVASQYLIVAKVPLSQLLQSSQTPQTLPQLAPNSPPWPSLYTLIVDFVLLCPSDFSPQLAIQLLKQQPEHTFPSDPQALAQFCAQAQFPLLQIPAQNQHIPQALTEQIRSHLKPAPL